MKRALLTVLLSIAMLFTFAFGFTGCKDGVDGSDGKDGIDGVDGNDGVGVADSYIDDDGYLILVLTDGKEINCGKVKPDGSDGLLYSGLEKNGNIVGYCVKSIGTAGANVVVPSTFNGKPVLEIGEEAFSGCNQLTSITVPDSVVTIGKNAFYNCENLKSVTLGGGLNQIGGSAFSKCENLESVNLTDVGAWCEVSLENISSSPFYFARELYVNNVLVTQLDIPDSAKSISDYAFYECSNITGVVIGNGATSIGDSAFGNCENLKSVKIGDSVTSIGDSAFIDCNNLAELVLGAKVKTISDFAFARCYLISEIDIPSSVETIGESAFSECVGLVNLNLNYGLKTIGTAAFAGCTALEKLIMPDSVTEIGFGIVMFEMGGGFIEGVVLSNSLTELVISGSLEEIPDFAFSKCNIQSVVIGNSVKTIRYSSFYGCELLQSIIMPTSVTNIQSYAFYKCTSLDTVYYLGTAEEWSKVVIGRNGNSISDATVYYYSETQPQSEGNFWHYENDLPVKW